MSEELSVFEVDYITEEGGRVHLSGDEVVAKDEGEAMDIVLGYYYTLKIESVSYLRKPTEQEINQYTSEGKT